MCNCNCSQCAFCSQAPAGIPVVVTEKKATPTIEELLQQYHTVTKAWYEAQALVQKLSVQLTQAHHDENRLAEESRNARLDYERAVEKASKAIP